MKRLAKHREERGWSKSELARRAGMHSSTVGLIEGQRLRPYRRQIEKLAAALEVEPTEIEEGQER